MKNRKTKIHIDMLFISRRRLSSPQADILKEVTTEIQALRSQFHVLQMQRDLSSLRSDILRAQSLLVDAGSKRLIEHDDSKLSSASAGKTEEAGVTQNISFPLSTGAVYERWGHDRCPNDTELVYSGVVAGSHFEHAGAAANTLCLPLNPVLDAIPSATTVTYIYGAEFKMAPLPRNDLDPLCAVCRSLRATVVMVPSAIACHSGWTMEYSGYLMAGHYTHTAATEFLCVDKEH